MKSWFIAWIFWSPFYCYHFVFAHILVLLFLCCPSRCTVATQRRHSTTRSAVPYSQRWRRRRSQSTSPKWWWLVAQFHALRGGWVVPRQKRRLSQFAARGNIIRGIGFALCLELSLWYYFSKRCGCFVLLCRACWFNSRNVWSLVRWIFALILHLRTLFTCRCAMR